jgi:hypothetical protein
VFRHPIERAISLFHYLQVAHWEPTYDPALKDWTLDQYATSSKIENNWLTRQLSDTPDGDLTQDHVTLALEIIRRKFSVGIMTEMKATTTRFEQFFCWKYFINPENQENCRGKLLTGRSNSNTKKKIDLPIEGSETWNLLAAQRNLWKAYPRTSVSKVQVVNVILHHCHMMGIFVQKIFRRIS